ncbi:MAG: AI-2E family transporter, partial [Roseibium sp.]
SPEKAKRAMDVIREINTRISDYLAMKTLINVILGGISFVILYAHGTDFALFWAVMIGLLNYIPYVGAYIGVFFPVVLSLAQFGSLPVTLSLAAFLTGAQVILGNIVEPRFIGRQVNLSPVVVLIALSVWTALWGISGAILAVPMTSVMAIILGSFGTTRFLAVLLADQVDEDAGDFDQ